MRAKIGALVAAVAAALSAAVATVWARRRKGPAGGGQAGNEPTRAPARAPAAEAQAQPAAAAAAEPAPAPEPEAPPVEAGAVDELTAIKGLGSVSVGRLHEIGVTTFAQIAGWSDEDIDEVGARIHISPERIRREDWVGQARAKLEG